MICCFLNTLGISTIAKLTNHRQEHFAGTANPHKIKEILLAKRPPYQCNSLGCRSALADMTIMEQQDHIKQISQWKKSKDYAKQYVMFQSKIDHIMSVYEKYKDDI